MGNKFQPLNKKGPCDASLPAKATVYPEVTGYSLVPEGQLRMKEAKKPACLVLTQQLYEGNSRNSPFPEQVSHLLVPAVLCQVDQWLLSMNSIM